MEIWIIGGIVVILMVIISTTIKRSAARAFEPEEIETDDFRIRKPDGFLHPLREPAEFPFEAYSKEYGERSTRNIWRARARLRVHESRTAGEILGEIKEKESDVVPVEVETNGGRTVLVSSRRAEDETEFLVRRKLKEAGSPATTWELRVTLLVPYENEFIGRAEEFLDSFEVKAGNPGGAS